MIPGKRRTTDLWLCEQRTDGDYDARLELGKWTESGYDDSGWQLAERMEAPKGKLVAQLSESEGDGGIKPISVKSVGDGRYIVDMGAEYGRNTAGETAWQEGQAHYHAFCRSAEGQWYGTVS